MTEGGRRPVGQQERICPGRGGELQACWRTGWPARNGVPPCPRGPTSRLTRPLFAAQPLPAACAWEQCDSTVTWKTPLPLILAHEISVGSRRRCLRFSQCSNAYAIGPNTPAGGIESDNRPGRLLCAKPPCSALLLCRALRGPCRAPRLATCRATVFRAVPLAPPPPHPGREHGESSPRLQP